MIRQGDHRGAGRRGRQQVAQQAIRVRRGRPVRLAGGAPLAVARVIHGQGVHEHQVVGTLPGCQGRRLEPLGGLLRRLEGEGAGDLGVALHHRPGAASAGADHARQRREDRAIHAPHHELHPRHGLPRPGPEHMLHRQGDRGEAGVHGQLQPLGAQAVVRRQGPRHGRRQAVDQQHPHRPGRSVRRSRLDPRNPGRRRPLDEEGADVGPAQVVDADGEQEQQGAGEDGVWALVHVGSHQEKTKNKELETKNEKWAAPDPGGCDLAQLNLRAMGRLRNPDPCQSGRAPAEARRLRSNAQFQTTRSNAPPGHR